MVNFRVVVRHCLWGVMIACLLAGPLVGLVFDAKLPPCGEGPYNSIARPFAFPELIGPVALHVVGVSVLVLRRFWPKALPAGPRREVGLCAVIFVVEFALAIHLAPLFLLLALFVVLERLHLKWDILLFVAMTVFPAVSAATFARQSLLEP